jgi:hypothetical protein
VPVFLAGTGLKPFLPENGGIVLNCISHMSDFFRVNTHSSNGFNVSFYSVYQPEAISWPAHA